MLKLDWSISVSLLLGKEILAQTRLCNTVVLNVRTHSTGFLLTGLIHCIMGVNHTIADPDMPLVVDTSSKAFTLRDI